LIQEFRAVRVAVHQLSGAAAESELLHGRFAKLGTPALRTI